MKNKLQKTSQFLFNIYLRLCLCWVVFALGIQVFFVYLQVSGQQERMLQYSNEFAWKFDGRFKNLPENISYEEPSIKQNLAN